MNDDRAYFERRQREELARAEAQADTGLRTLHRRWAALYGERLALLGSGLPAMTAGTTASAQPLASSPQRTGPHLRHEPTNGPVVTPLS